MIRVLFVCLGNICRSPMAEAVFTQLVEAAGLSAQIEADSAGTSGYHDGDAAHPNTLRVLKEHGIAYAGRSRRIESRDLQHFDYVVAMDEDNLSDINSLANNTHSTAKIARLLDFAPAVNVRNVPDPFYNGGFQQVYELVLAGSQGLLGQIRKDHAL